MIIPPFPSKDLAKLVLGYLAEEQLMTAYDEFLQASPYLNAHGNEYARIFMTSLKNILAEYRAVKIHVETCKPFILRKKLLQCSNLLEMVKFLIQYVDVNKINTQDTLIKSSVDKHSAIENTLNCEVCNSIKREVCTCKSYDLSNVPLRGQNQDCSENSVEATALSDLPGSHTKSRRRNLTIPNDGSLSQSNHTLTEIPLNEQTSHQGPKPLQILTTIQEKDELNTNPNQVCHQIENSNVNLIPPQHNQMNPVEGYNNFATGVIYGTHNPGIPGSSTSENMNINSPISTPSTMKIRQTRTQYLLKLSGNGNAPSEFISINTVNNCPVPKPASKLDESKIKILSDVKVDHSLSSTDMSGTLKMPAVLKNATSTPLLQMHTIVINGTPVYKQTPFGQQNNFTKDEIMAMPTIILAPASGASQVPANVQMSAAINNPPHDNMLSTQSLNTITSLEPLTIDVTDDDTDVADNNTQINTEINKKGNVSDRTVPKTNDNITSASAPKDIITSGFMKVTTPQVFPPLRKSSSTPRRTSHVRVLDFTTPRRILHETASKGDDVEVVISKSSNDSYSEVPNTQNKETGEENNEKCKDNTVKDIAKKKNSWDTDLRALAIAHEQNVDSIQLPKSENKTMKKKRLSKSQQPQKEHEKEKQGCKKKKTKEKLKKNVSPKKKEIPLVPNYDVPKKPTINIIAGSERRPSVSDNDKSHNKSSNENPNKSNSDITDTPDLERISLQNEIGAKLNISDLLETPYKQALYDIQMETPRFLGPDIPDDPMSDIKIMNIPTPRFLNAPTPSSYSSRPTDYSSGGSYYKPDDQDYMRIPDDAICPVTSSSNEKDNQDTNISSVIGNDIGEKNQKQSRPVRKCTKNVSYYKSGNANNKSKEGDDKDVNSSFSDLDVNSNGSSAEKENKGKDNKINVKSDKNVSAKKVKSPIKKDTPKSSVKAKTKRATPSKAKKDLPKKTRKTSESVKVVSRKKSKNKEESSSTPAILSVPTKSRRKSSTPRKLHCTKTFNSESSGHDSPELISRIKNVPTVSSLVTTDSDTEQLPLRWSDDGSQDEKLKEVQAPPATDIEDINKIQEYIDTMTNTSEDGTFHGDLVKRGFDLETAKIIERELLDMSPATNTVSNTKNKTDWSLSPTIKVDNVTKDKTNDDIILDKIAESMTSNTSQIIQEGDEDNDDIVLSVHHCDEESTNYYSCVHDDNTKKNSQVITKLKDKFSMEICLDDDLTIRLRATPYSLLFDQNPALSLLNQNDSETENAVKSISNLSNFFTPVKEAIKAQCYEIFDSTLTSLDTPLKSSPKTKEHISVTEIVLEVEKLEDKVDVKKRKRGQSGNLSDESLSENKKVKPDTQYLFNSANIQNIDIESVLSKLHGP